MLCHLQERESNITKLRDRENTLSLQLLKAENCNSSLEQDLSDAQAALAALNIELRDNVQRWEQECTVRMEAEEAFQQASADLVQAKSAARDALESARNSDYAKVNAMQHLSFLCTRKRNISAVKV